MSGNAAVPPSLFDSICSNFDYTSTRFIRVKNKKLSCIYYSIILLVLGYVIGFTIISEKGYQESKDVVGTTIVKVKGTGTTSNDTDSLDGRILDANDLVMPPNEVDGVFIATSEYSVYNQTQDICTGHQIECNGNHDCDSGDLTSEGQLTGNCLDHTGFCEIRGWCPTESGNETLYKIYGVGDFTLYLRTTIHIPGFHKSKSNTEDKTGTGAPVYGYNLFQIDDILKKSTSGHDHYHHTIESYEEIIDSGAIIMGTSTWNCDLDRGMKYCEPSWEFLRIDSLSSKSISSGYNYRDTTYSIGYDQRTLRKLYGIKIVFATAGSGSKFSLLALSVTFGAGLAYLSIAKFITDFILEKFLTESDLYAARKTRNITEEEEGRYLETLATGQDESGSPGMNGRNGLLGLFTTANNDSKRDALLVNEAPHDAHAMDEKMDEAGQDDTGAIINENGASYGTMA